MSGSATSGGPAVDAAQSHKTAFCSRGIPNFLLRQLHSLCYSYSEGVNITPNPLYTSLPAPAHCLFRLLFYLLFQLHIIFAIRLSGRKVAIKLID